MFNGRILIGNQLKNRKFQKQERRIFYLDSDCDGVNFSESTIPRSIIIRSDFFKCNVSRVKISNSTVYAADFRQCNLNRTHFVNCTFYKTLFFGCKLSHVVFENCRFKDVLFIDYDMRESTFSNSEFKETDFAGRNLRGTNFENITADRSTMESLSKFVTIVKVTPSLFDFFPLRCPETGEFYAYKKVRDDRIVKLLIPEDARRSSATSNKCRCDKAKVVEILECNGEKSNVKRVKSLHDPSFVYTLGEMVSVPNFDDNRFNECAPGIHFFMSFEEAQDYS